MSRLSNSTVYFRTHGGSSIGLGHLFRCLAVAEALCNDFGVAPKFIVNNDPIVRSILKKHGWLSLEWDETLTPKEQVFGIVNDSRENSVRACLIDMKTDVSQEIRAWKACKANVVLMDNITSARLLTDTNIYPSINSKFNTMDWGGYDGQVFGGREWIPIANKFISLREEIPAIELRKFLLVTMGGADPSRLTKKVMESLREILDVPIRIVLGFAFNERETIRKLNLEFKGRFEINEDSNQMELLMKESGLAITALGTTIYELGCLGVPTIVLSNYREDMEDENVLRKSGWVIPLGYHATVDELKIRSTVLKVWQDVGRRAEMSRVAFQTVDGNGAFRISELLMRIHI